MGELSHVTGAGDVRMVDVGSKPLSRRRAVARGVVRMAPETAALQGLTPCRVCDPERPDVTVSSG